MNFDRQIRQNSISPESDIAARSPSPVRLSQSIVEQQHPPKRLILLIVFVATIMAWGSPSFAQQNVNGGAPVTLNGAGNADGVAFTGQGVTPSTLNASGGNINNNNNAVGVSSDSPNASTINFTTSSTVFGTVGAVNPLLNINANGAGGTALTFNGSTNSAQIHVGAETVNFNSGTANAAQLIFTQDSTISIGAGTLVTGALTTTAGDNTGTLVLNNASNLTGAVGALNTSLKAISVLGGSVSAGITGAVNAYTFNLGSNTLNISGGALTIANQGPGGVINTTLNSALVYGNINVAGASNLATTLGLNVTVPGATFIPVGTIFTIVKETGAGTPGSVLAITSSNPLYQFVQVPASGGTLTNGPVQIQLVGSALNVAPSAAGAALPAANQTPDIIIVEAAINALTDPAAAINALAQLGPSSANIAAGLVSFQNAGQFQDLWQSRVNDVMCGAVDERRLEDATPICRKNEPTSGWWVKSFGYFGSQDRQNSFAGYDSRTFGTMIAYDAPLPVFRDTSLGLETRIGAGIGYAQTTINDKAFPNSTNFNTYQATAYVSHEHGPWFVNGDLSFGWNDYSSTRYVAFPGISRKAQAGYSGQTYTAFGTSGIHLPAGDFAITPFGSLQYTHVSLAGYAETGAGDISLKVNAQDYDFIQSGLGAKVTRPFAANGGTYVPEAHTKWLHNILNPTLLNTASFTGGSPQFTAPGLKTSGDTFNVGAGLTFLSCSCSANNWSLEAVYDYYWTPDNYSAHQGTLKFSARF